MKITTLEKFLKIRKIYKKKNIKTVLAHGVFDVFHIGHVYHLQEAKKYADKLIVSITLDKFVNKGDDRPIFNTNERAKLLSELNLVDHVIISQYKSSIQIIKKLKPDFYIKGKDYEQGFMDLQKNLNNEIKAVESVKGQFITSRTKLYSSSKIVGMYDLNINDNAKKFLEKNINKEKLKKKIFKNFSKKINKKVLCIGDPIIDKLKYVELLGKSAKSNILSSRLISEKNYGGGIFLVINFLQNYINKIDYLTYSNAFNDKIFKKFIDKEIKIIKIQNKNCKVISKTRYIDNYSKNKLFQNNIEDNLRQNLDTKLSNKFKKLSKNYDVILIFDYGHGFINESLIKELNKNNNKLFINCQSNSSNFGFNIAKKYKGGIGLSIDELEFRLSVQNKFDAIEKLILKNKKFINLFKNFIITQGKLGCNIHTNKKNNFIPSIIQNPKDATGCGDIFFSTFLLAKLHGDFTNEEIGFLCHLTAGMHAQKEGNQNIVNNKSLFNFVKIILG